MYAFIKSYLINDYNLIGGNQLKMLEHIKIVYPFHSNEILYYDISELLFFCIVPIYLYILASRAILSILAKD